MSELVLLHHNEPMTTSLAIAEGTENTHQAVMKMVKTYVSELQNFGEVGFQIRLNPQGSPTEFAFLNEPQATLLITFLRNSEIVVRFKVALVKAFYELRGQLAAAVPPAPTFGAVNHRADVTVSADRTFRAVLRSSRAAGLRLPAALQRANAITIRDTGIDMLETIGVDPAEEAPARQAEDDGGALAFADAWLAGELPLPATICRSSDLYAAYQHWRNVVGCVTVCPINRFPHWVTSSRPEVTKRHLTVQVGNRRVTARGYVVGNILQTALPNTQAIVTATEMSRFAVALAEWQAETG